MRIYTVHLPPAAEDTDDSEALASAALIKEGFSWLGFVFSLVWALWHRLWWAALGIVAVSLAAEFVLALADANEAVRTVVSVAIALAIGFTANDLRRWTLARRGWREAAVVAGEDADAAFERYLAAAARPAPPPRFGLGFTGGAA